MKTHQPLKRKTMNRKRPGTKTMKRKQHNKSSKRRMKGGYGPATFNGQLPYELNRYDNAVTNPDNIVSSRMMAGGNKKTKRKNKSKKMKKNKKMKGGSFFLPKMVSFPTHFDTTSGAIHNANIMGGEEVVDPRSYVQPLINAPALI